MRDTIDMAREARLERNGYWEFDMNRLKAFEALVRANEREACAKVCETHAPTTTPTWVSYAATIRARGNT
jgi:hypothetical protein